MLEVLDKAEIYSVWHSILDRFHLGHQKIWIITTCSYVFNAVDLKQDILCNTLVFCFWFSLFRFGDDGCRRLCKGLTGNKTLLSLSLCYCNLKMESGKILGYTVANTAIRFVCVYICFFLNLYILCYTCYFG